MLFWLLTILVVFLLGGTVGSFLNVLVSRSIAGEQWVTGRSRCDHCKKVLFWFDMIPFFSYLLLRGKTRCCKKTLSLNHPVVELLVGLLFVWWYGVGFVVYFQLTNGVFPIVQPLFWLCVALILLHVSLVDLKSLSIPSVDIILLTVLALGYRLLLVKAGVMQPNDLVNMLLAMLVVAGSFWGLWMITKKRGIGLGDVLLVVPLTLLTGWPGVVVLLYTAVISGSVVGVTLLIYKKVGRKYPLPFGPFLVLGTVVSLLWSDAIIQWYLQLL